MTEEQIRAQFDDVRCADCLRVASEHALHGATWHRNDECVWTWLGVVQREFKRACEAYDKATANVG